MNPNTPTFRNIHTFTYTLILLQFYVCTVCSICFCIKNFPVLRKTLITVLDILITNLDNLISLLDFTFRLEDIYIYQICVSRAKMISLNFVLECVAEFAATRFISASIRYWQELKSCSARLYAFLNIAFYVKRAI